MEINKTATRWWVGVYWNLMICLVNIKFQYAPTQPITRHPTRQPTKNPKLLSFQYGNCSIWSFTTATSAGWNLAKSGSGGGGGEGWAGPGTYPMGRWWWPWAGAGVVRQPKAVSGLGLGHVMAHVHVCVQCLLPVVQKNPGACTKH